LELSSSLSVFFDAVYFLLDYRSMAQASGLANVVPVDPARLFPNLNVPNDWGWRCGDFCYFALHEFLQDSGLRADKIWLVESDVVFQCDVKNFFTTIDSSAQFVAAKVLQGPLEKWYWAEFIRPFYPVEHCFFPLTRIDFAVIPELKKARSEVLKACSERLKFLPNDESFVASYMKAKGYAFLDLKQSSEKFFEHFDCSKRLVFNSTDAIEKPLIVHGAVRFSELISQFLSEEKSHSKSLDQRLVKDDKVFVKQMFHLAESRAAVSSHLTSSKHGVYQMFQLIETFISELDSPEDLPTRRFLSDYFNAALLSDGTRFNRLNHMTQSVKNRAYLAGIEWKNGVAKAVDVSSPSDFTEKTIFPVALLDLDLSSYVPYCLDIKNEHVVLTPANEQLRLSPFLYQAQRALSSQVLRIPFEAYKNHFLLRNDDISRLNFIFSIGRCSSALVGTLASNFGSPTFSEPDVFFNLKKKTVGSEAQLLNALCKHFVMLSPCSVSRITIKLRAENSWLMPFVARHVKGAKILFLTRGLSAWQKAYASKFPRPNAGLLRLLRNCFDAYQAALLFCEYVPCFKFESFSTDPYAMLKEILGHDVDRETYESKLREVLPRDSQAGTEIGTFEKNSGAQALLDAEASEFLDFFRSNMTPEEIRFFDLE